MINGSPKIMCLTVDFHENLSQVPLPVRVCAHPTCSLITNFSSEHWTKSVPPKSKRFVADVDTTLVEQVFDVSKRKRKPNVRHHSKANDLRTGHEVAKWVGFCHLAKLRNHPARLKPVSSDSTSHSACPISADLGDEHRAKSIPPESNRFVANLDAAFVQQVLDIPQGKWKPEAYHRAQRITSGLVLV